MVVDLTIVDLKIVDLNTSFDLEIIAFEVIENFFEEDTSLQLSDLVFYC